MVKVVLSPLSEKEFLEVLRSQHILKLRGGALKDINIFRANRRSLRGEGILDSISSLGKMMFPALKKYILPATKEFTKGIMNDVIRGKNLKESFKQRGKKGLQKIGSTILHGKGLKTKKSLPSYQKSSRAYNRVNKKIRKIKRVVGLKKLSTPKINKEKRKHYLTKNILIYFHNIK